jgi:hypothetical protein
MDAFDPARRKITGKATSSRRYVPQSLPTTAQVSFSAAAGAAATVA